MDTARDKHTNEPVEAEDLWLLQHVDRGGYICAGCTAAATPCSFEPHNKVRPHFRIDEHEPGCDVKDAKALATRGRTARVSDDDGLFPGAYPDRLNLRDESGGGGASVEQGRERTTPRTPEAAPAESGKRRRPWAAATIRPLCKQFVRFPYDRHVELHVPGLRGSTYASVFRRIQWNALARYPDMQLFYVPLRWNRPDSNDDRLELLVDAGERDTNGSLLRGCRVRAAWTSWSAAKRTYVRNEIEAARAEAKTARDAGHAKQKAWLFFIGRQDRDDASLFVVDDHRLICCLVVEMAYPPRTTPSPA